MALAPVFCVKTRFDATERSLLLPQESERKLSRRSLGMMSGAVVGQRYRIGRTIGSGGMGCVYEAVDLQTGLEVALKALPPGAPDPTQLTRLRREAAAASSVKSDYVCRVHYLGVERGTPFIVMERLHGHTLRTRLDSCGPLSLKESIGIALQLLDALIATHAAGVIHRDIKPSNVFLAATTDSVPRVKVIDFGLAKLANRAEDSLGSNAVAGTLQYLPPEQLMGVGELDERSDVYAAGLTLFEMLIGRRVYKGSYAEIVHEIVLGEPPSLCVSRPDLPLLLGDVLGMAMAKARERRFASAFAFRRALVAAIERGEISESGICPAIETEIEGLAPPDESGASLVGQREAAPDDVGIARSASDRRAEDPNENSRPTARPPSPSPDVLEDELPTLRPPPLGTGGFDDEPTARRAPYTPTSSDIVRTVSPPQGTGRLKAPPRRGPRSAGG
jgi:eukaryotic-like serine/threonine-protein kinase